VFGLSRALQVWVHTEPTDMRKSFNTLSALVSEEMHREVLSIVTSKALSGSRPRRHNQLVPRNSALFLSPIG